MLVVLQENKTQKNNTTITIGSCHLVTKASCSSLEFLLALAKDGADQMPNV